MESLTFYRKERIMKTLVHILLMVGMIVLAVDILRIIIRSAIEKRRETRTHGTHEIRMSVFDAMADKEIKRSLDEREDERLMWEIEGPKECFSCSKHINIILWLREWAGRSDKNFAQVVYDIYYLDDNSRIPTTEEALLRKLPKELSCSFEDLRFAVEELIRLDVSGVECGLSYS